MTGIKRDKGAINWSVLYDSIPIPSSISDIYIYIKKNIYIYIYIYIDLNY